MIPEERVLAAVQLRNLAELTRYRVEVTSRARVYEGRQLATATAEAVALLAEILATVIEDRADVNEEAL